MPEQRKYTIEVVPATDEAEIDALGDIHGRGEYSYIPKPG